MHVRYRCAFSLSDYIKVLLILPLFLGCGLATLEVAANSYIAVLGTPKYAAARLNFSQGFQGVASFAGPLIASRWFFTGKNATSLDTVQWYVFSIISFLSERIDKFWILLTRIVIGCTLPLPDWVSY